MAKGRHVVVISFEEPKSPDDLWMAQVVDRIRAFFEEAEEPNGQLVMQFIERSA
jgi:hypothetical protein